jgi:hypothetical protein
VGQSVQRIFAFGHWPCKEELPVTSFEAGCEKKCASPYIGERFGENSVGGKWLIGAGLRIPLTLLGRRQGAVGGGEIILLNCCKWLQINRTFFQVVTARLRSETTLPIKWIAARVQIGTAKGAKSVLPHLAQSQDQRKAASALEPCAQLEFQSPV